MFCLRGAGLRSRFTGKYFCPETTTEDRGSRSACPEGWLHVCSVVLVQLFLFSCACSVVGLLPSLTNEKRLPATLARAGSRSP